MWQMVIAMIVAVAAWWFLRNRKTETNTRPPEYPEIPEAPNHGDISLDEAFQSAWVKLYEIDGGIQPPDLDFGVVPGAHSGHVGAAWRACVNNEDAIVDPTLTGPVVYYYHNGKLWLLTLTDNSPVSEELYQPVFERLTEISQPH